MGDRELLLLEVAAIVHDIGLFVAARGHHRHAYYLLKHSEIFGLSGADLEIVANVARYHRRAGPQADHPAYASLPRTDRVTVNRLSGILRVADALDKSHAQRIQNPKITVAGDELRIDVDGIEDLALERLALDQKSALFEVAFVSWKLTRPSPLIAEVTSSSAHAPVTNVPNVPICAPVAAGLLFHVIPVSVQEFDVGKTAPPRLLPSVQNRRSFADVTEPERPERSKRR